MKHLVMVFLMMISLLLCGCDRNQGAEENDIPETTPTATLATQPQEETPQVWANPQFIDAQGKTTIMDPYMFEYGFSWELPDATGNLRTQYGSVFLQIDPSTLHYILSFSIANFAGQSGALEFGAEEVHTASLYFDGSGYTSFEVEDRRRPGDRIARMLCDGIDIPCSIRCGDSELTFTLTSGNFPQLCASSGVYPARGEMTVKEAVMFLLNDEKNDAVLTCLAEFAAEAPCMEEHVLGELFENSTYIGMNIGNSLWDVCHYAQGGCTETARIERGGFSQESDHFDRVYTQLDDTEHPFTISGNTIETHTGSIRIQEISVGIYLVSALNSDGSLVPEKCLFLIKDGITDIVSFDRARQNLIVAYSNTIP